MQASPRHPCHGRYDRQCDEHQPSQRVSSTHEKRSYENNRGQGAIYNGGQYSIGPRKTRELDVLQDRLVQLHSVDEDRPATIDAREGIVYEDVVRVLDAAMNADFKEVTFVGSYE